MSVRPVSVTVALAALAMTMTASYTAAARQSPPPRLAVCSILPKDVVKRHLPWQDMFDKIPPEEEPIGSTGSSCNYPTVHVQVLAYTPAMLAGFRKAGANEAISGVGDEAWFRNNRDQYAELVVKVGQRLLTLQADADDGIVAAKPKVIELAKAYVAKLR